MNFQQEVARFAVQTLCSQHGHEMMRQYDIQLTGLPDLTVDDVQRLTELSVTFGVFVPVVNTDQLKRCYARLQEERTKRCILYELIRAEACDELIQRFYPEYSRKADITNLRKRHGMDLQRGTPKSIDAADAVKIEAWMKDNDCDPETMKANQWLNLGQAMDVKLRCLWHYFYNSVC